MKRTLLLVLNMLVALVLMAGNVTPEQAAQTALQFMEKHQPAVRQAGLKMAARKALSVTPAAEATAYYVFNVGTDAGYVMVSGSDLAPQVLGYATSGSFRQEAMPDNMRSWLQGYADQIAWLEQTQGAYNAPRPDIRRAAVDPLLKSTWGQGNPYNGLCPMDGTKQAVTGCVATALAQVMYYHRWPEETFSIPAYTTRTRGIEMPEIPETTIDWDNMLDSYSGNETAEQKNAVAQLMLLCGQAVSMDYTSSGSNSNTDMDGNALRNYFDYDETVQVLHREYYGTSAWENLIYGEVAASRPVLYGGSSTSSGHSFVIDGYNGDGYFHVNWGWYGSDNGYFLLSVLNPYNNVDIGSNSTNDGYSFDQDAVIGIQHGSGKTAAERLTMAGAGLYSNSTFTRGSSAVDFTNVGLQLLFYNMSGYEGNFLLGIALQDDEGNWVKSEVLTQLGPWTLANNRGKNGALYVSFGANVPDGDYYLVPVCKSDNSADWENCWQSELYRIKATISEKTLKLTAPFVNLALEDIKAVGSTEVGTTVKLQATIKNNGSYFNEDFILVVDGNPVAGQTLDIPEGGTGTLNIEYVPVKIGTNQLTLCYKIGYGYTLNPFGTGSIEVTADVIGVTDALAIINALGNKETTDKQYVVKGIVNGAVSYNPQYRELSFNLKDTDNNNQMRIYRANNYQGERIDSAGLVKEGDEVIIMGRLQNYSATSKELVYGTILSIGDEPAPIDEAISVEQASIIGSALENKAVTSEVYRIQGYVIDNPVIQKRTDGTYYGNANFTMASQPNGSAITITGYRVRGLNNVAIESDDYIQKGDKIVVMGQLQNWNSSIEVVNGYLVSLERDASGIRLMTADEPLSDVRYNLAGQKVSDSYRGIVIVGGRKMLNK